MKDNDENILYIGKSKNLKSRVNSYFRKSNDLSPRIFLMVKQIYDIEFIITDSEVEALTLESNLIKQNNPYFNILLKDDKKYPYICISWSDQYPSIYITRRRRTRRPKDKFYGPYVDVSLLRSTINIIKKIFPVRQRLRPLYKDKTCLNYSIDRCPGVCQELISPIEYRKTIKNIAMIFEGQTDQLKDILKSIMLTYSDNLEFEKALKVKKQIEGIDILTQSQKMIDPDSSINRDAIAIAQNEKFTCVHLFQMRSGKLIARLAFTIDTDGLDKKVIIQQVIEKHYSELSKVEIPNEILVEVKLNNQLVLEEWITDLKGMKVRLLNPKRNKKSEFIKLVKRNAELELNRLSESNEQTKNCLEDLANLLDLESIPKRIEGYDISHIQGSDPVASQVVFIDGIPAKHHYRKYKIKNEKVKLGHSDDYLSIYEVIVRRFKRWSKYKQDGLDFTKLRNSNLSILDSSLASDLPDLIMIDGGKGQLNSAINALQDLQLEGEIKVCSLAKKNEDLFIPFHKQPLDSQKDEPAILLLRRLRDEAHRFAVSFHRDRRTKRLKRSVLSEIPGLGPKKIKCLLSHFKSIQAIQYASREEISLIPGLGRDLASNIWNYFNEE